MKKNVGYRQRLTAERVFDRQTENFGHRQVVAQRDGQRIVTTEGLAVY